MGITVREVLALKEFHAFQLVAGESGLDNRIETIGILDYEFSVQHDEQPKKWGFRKYDFVLTSLLFAKGREGCCCRPSKSFAMTRYARWR